MTGGLIQLVTTGIQDSPIIGNPEITFFKTIYRQHTNFSLCQHERNIGTIEFNKESSKIIERNGDLLYNQIFRIEIPYFDIVKKTIKQTKTDNGYDFSNLSVTFMNSYCLIYYLENNDSWYIIPEKLFKLSSFTSFKSLIESIELTPNLLPDYIRTSDLNQFVTNYQLKDNDKSSIINILRITSNFFEQFWIDWVSKTDDINMLNQLITIKSFYNKLNLFLKKRMFDIYYLKNNYYKNQDYFDFSSNISSEEIIIKTETERYFEHLYSNITNNLNFDIDIAKKFCEDNLYDFNDYKKNIVTYNSLIVLSVLKMLYSSSELYTFWNKYEIDQENLPNLNVNLKDTNIQNEWKENINKILNETLGVTSLKNPLYEILINNYFKIEEKNKDSFKDTFKQIEVNGKYKIKNIYASLKIFMDRFLLIPDYQLNFNNGYINNRYPDNCVKQFYLQNNYDELLKNELLNYPNLISDQNKLSNTENKNLSPVDIQNIYGVVAEELSKVLFNFLKLDLGLKSMIVLWKNCVINRLYKRYLDYSSFGNKNEGLTNYGGSRLLTFYYSMNLTNLYNFKEFSNSFYEMFYKNSWIGTLNYNINDFLKLKENINYINLHTLNTTDFTNINSNNNFVKLNISNKYTYQYLVDQYDENQYSQYLMEPTDNYDKNNYKKIRLELSTNKLYLRYDNFYDENSQIKLLYDNNELSWSSMEYKILINERNFNSIYLVFNDVKVITKQIYLTDYLNLEKISLINLVITMEVNYETFIPVVCFSNETMNYPNIEVKKYYLLSKYNNNKIRLLNIEESGYEVSIDNSVDNENNLKILTINYIDPNNKINPPIYLKSSVEDSKTNYSLDIGTYIYRITFYNSTEESLLGESVKITITENNKLIKLEEIPISLNLNVIGRRIYRTKVNGDKFYLLKEINNNENTVLIDDITDDKLGIDYTIDSSIKYINISENNSQVSKQIVNLVKNDNFYIVKDLNGENIILPKNYDNILDIYIEVINFNKNKDKFKLIESNNYTMDSTGSIVLNESYDKNYLYWLVNSKTYQENIKLLPNKKNVPFKSPAFKLSYIESNTMENGLYKYKISFYNTITEQESLSSNDISIIINNNDQIKISEFSPIFDKTFNSWKIYRTKKNENTFYQLDILIETENDLYIDKKKDEELQLEYQNIKLRITQPINTHLINKFTRQLILKDEYLDWQSYNDEEIFQLNQGTYKYTITFSNDQEETIKGSETVINITVPNNLSWLTSKGRVKITIPESNDPNVTHINIYRTKINGDNFFLLKKFEISTLNSYEYIDNELDEKLIVPIPLTNNKMNSYNILKILNTEITPNLHSFISHSTDLRFANEKNISDLNDYLFNKPFIMLINDKGPDTFNNSNTLKQSLQTTNAYFYNIPFKINSSSIITIDNKNSSYLIPLSSQQFFNKTDSKYYSVDLKNNLIVETLEEQIIQKSFNPSFDEFNISDNFLNSNNYSYILVDQILEKFNDIIITNPEFKLLIDLIDNINNEFISIKTILDYNNLFGSTTKKILFNLKNINKVSNAFNDKIYNIDLLSYSNLDYLKYSHYALELKNIEVKDLKYIKLNIYDSDVNLTKFKVISPVYQYYDATKKISVNLKDYLKNVSSFFSEHIEFINKNSDYLNISDSNNYQEQFLSTDEITQHKYNNFYEYNNTDNQINLLHPIIEKTKISKINIKTDNLTTINNFSITSDKTITTNEFNENILENNFNDSKFKFENRNEYKTDKFNYLGLCHIDNNSEVNLDDKYIVSNGTKYFQLDDKKIYLGTADNTLGRYYLGKNDKENKLLVSSLYCSNPYELKFGDSNLYLELEKTEGYYYKFNISWNTCEEITLNYGNSLPNATENQYNYFHHLIENKIYYSDGNNWILSNDQSNFIITNSNNPNYINRVILIQNNGNFDWGIQQNINIECLFYINNNYYNGVLENKINYAFLYIISPNKIEADFNELFYSNNLKSQSIKNITVEQFKYYNFDGKINNFDFNYFKFGNKYYYSNEILKTTSPEYTYKTNPSYTDEDLDMINQSFLFNKIFIFFSSSDLDDFTKITANNGLLNSVNEEIYRVYNNNLYKSYKNGDEYDWDFITPGNYLINSDNLLFNDKYCSIFDNQIIKNSVQCYYKSDFEKIIANNGDSTNNDIGSDDDYIIDNNNLFKKINSKWKLVINGSFIIKSNNLDFNNKKVQINLTNFTEIQAEETISIIESPTSNGYYIYQNKLFEFTGNWNQIITGLYKIESTNNNYNNRFYLIESNGLLNQIYNSLILYDSNYKKIDFISITANEGNIWNSKVISNSYIIFDNKLYIGVYKEWKLILGGYYKFQSNINFWNNKFVNINMDGIMNVVNNFNQITANNITETVSENQYVIDNNLLYQKIGSQLVKVKSDFYLLSSNNSNYNSKYVKITDGKINIVSNQLLKPNQNKVTRDLLTPMTIKNSVVYSYYQDYDFSKKLKDVDYDNWILLIDTNILTKRHFMLKLNEIKNKQIPCANYNIWILPMKNLPIIRHSNQNISINQNGEITNLNSLQDYSYYLIKYNGSSYIYYFETGNSIIPNDIDIQYNLKAPQNQTINISEIFIINNDIFNTNFKQLVKIYDTIYLKENFINKELQLSVKQITANKGTSTNDSLGNNNDYIIDYNNLYQKIDSEWQIITYGNYFIKSDNLDYKNKNVEIYLNQFTKKTANTIESIDEPPLNQNIYYIFQNQLWEYKDNNWQQIFEGDFKIISDSVNYNNKYFNIDSDGFINQIKNSLNILENKIEFYNGMTYNSFYLKTIYDVKYLNEISIGLDGDNLFLVTLFLKSKTDPILFLKYPIFFKKEEKVIFPNLKVYFNIDESDDYSIIDPNDVTGTKYDNSLIPINYDKIITTNVNDTKIIINDDLIIGKFFDSYDGYEIKSLSPYLEFNPTTKILKIKSGYDIYNNKLNNQVNFFHFWKLELKNISTGYTNIIIFWTFFTKSINLIEEYLKINVDSTSDPKIGIYQPYSNKIINNFGKNHILTGSYPDIFEQDIDNLLIKDYELEKDIAFKYYTDTRHENKNLKHKIKKLNYNYINNNKPSIEKLSVNVLKNINTKQYQNLYDKIMVYILIWNDDKELKTLTVFLKSELDKYTSYFTKNSLSIYYTTSLPQFVSNHIKIYPSSLKDDTLYSINYCDKLYLEMGEIIIIDDNYFYVEGFNVFTDNYDLKLIRTGKGLIYEYYGYYTIGNYLSKNNKIIPDFNYDDINTYKSHSGYNDDSYGEFYYSNIMSKVFIKNGGWLEYEKDINILNESYLNIKLLHNQNKLYQLDNFVKLKVLDKIIDDYRTIYEIKDIKDGEIILDKDLYESDNLLLNFRLPYQPFKNKYINFDSNGNILSEIIPDNQSIIFDYIIPIIANNNLTTSNPVQINTYIFENNKLYKGIESGWYEYQLNDPINEGTYLIDNNKLYIGTNIEWKTVNGNYNIKYEDYYAEIDGTLNKYEKYEIDYTMSYIHDILYVKDEQNNRVIQQNKYYKISSFLQIPYFENQYIKTNEHGKIFSLDNNLFVVRNNKINVDSTFLPGFRKVRIWETDYWSQFENVFDIPNKGEYHIDENYPCKLKLKYDESFGVIRFYFNKNELKINTNIFYFLQPIKISGTYNYIKSIITYDDDPLVVFYLLNDIPYTLLQDQEIDIIFSPKKPNNVNLYSQLKIKYNFGIQIDNYKELNDAVDYNNTFKQIEVIRYILKNDELIFIEKIRNYNSIVFEYGKSIEYNERINNINKLDGYTSIYFYKYKQINSDGRINNFDTLIGSYHLIIEKIEGGENIHLAKIIYPNKLKIYTKFTSSDNDTIVNRVFNMKINNHQEFTYSPLLITESRNLVEINEKQVEIIQKYNINLYDTPEILTTNNITTYKYKFKELGDGINQIFKYIYTDEKLTNSCKLTVENNNQEYSFISNNYLSNDLKIIYTKLDNYLVSTTKNKNLKTTKLINDKSLEKLVNSNVLDVENFTLNMIVSKISSSKPIYFYKTLDNSNLFTLQTNQTYYIDKNNLLIEFINPNNRTISVKDVIDNDKTEISNDYYTSKLYVENKIDTSLILDSNILFNDVKQMKTKLLANSYIDDSSVFNYLKPWKNWSLLNSIKKVNQLSGFCYYGKLSFSGTELLISSDLTGKYITIEEYNKLSKFIENVTKYEKSKTNFLIMRNEIEPYILNNLTNWLYNPSFFLDVKTNINTFLNMKFAVTFDGNNILFNDDLNVELYNNEVASYITNEFTYDQVENTVYRSADSYDKINVQINNWINKITDNNINTRFFGVSIHKLCRYLVEIGQQLIELINYFNKPFIDTPEYFYNNPLKFIINKMWEKYCNNTNINKLNKEFSDKMELKYNIDYINNILSSINYNNNITFSLTGIYSNNIFNNFTYLREFIISNLTKYDPNIFINLMPTYKLLTDEIYPYLINFKGSEIIPNKTYSIDFLNGEKITEDIMINNPEIYTDQLRFYSSYNIKSTDFITVKQNNEFSIQEITILGTSYIIKFNNNINVNKIDQIYYRSYNLPILSINNTNYINILVPYTNDEKNLLNEININDSFELRNSIGIKYVEIINNKQYLYFYSNKFVFIEDKTVVKTKSNIYILQNDGMGYFIEGINIKSTEYDINIITMVNLIEIKNMKEIMIDFKTEPLITDSKNRPVNDNIIIPFEYEIYNSTNKISFKPIKINTYGDGKIIFNFTNDDYNNIVHYNLKNFDKIKQVKKVDQEITNKINNIELYDEYLYRFEDYIERTTDTKIFLYNNDSTNLTDHDEIDAINEIFEPTSNKLDKTSIFIKQNKEKNQTIFSVKKNYQTTYLKNIYFIQKNSWIIENYNVDLENQTIKITISKDFVFKFNGEYYYQFGNPGQEHTIDKSTIVKEVNENNLQVSFSWTHDLINGDANFFQYFIGTTSVTKPINNRKAKMTIDYPYQYKNNVLFYTQPYSGTGKEFGNYMYKITTFDLSKNNLLGYEGGVCDEVIYLFKSGSQINGKLFDRFFDSDGFINLIFTVDIKLDLSNQIIYTYRLADLVDKQILKLEEYQTSFNLVDYYEQTQSNEIFLLVKDNMKPYFNSSDLIQKPSKFYLVSYIPYILTNIFNENKFIINKEMQKNYSFKSEEIITYENINWKPVHKMFEYIRIFFNDQLMEELNEDVFLINYFLYYSDERRKKSNTITKIRKTNEEKWQCYIPLIFWFTNKPGLSIPIIALPHTQIRLVYKLNDIKNAVTNDLNNAKFRYRNQGIEILKDNPEMTIYLNTDFILLDTLERKLFGSLSHEYMIERFIKSPINFINNPVSDTKSLKLSGLIKDIHFISKPVNYTDISYYPEVITNYDMRYSKYLNALNYYNEWIKNNKIYTSTDQQKYNLEIDWIDFITNNLNIYFNLTINQLNDSNLMNTYPYYDIKRLINQFSNWSIYDKELLRYLYFYQIFYIVDIWNEYYNGDQQLGGKLDYLLSIYLKYLYSNKKIVNEISPVESMVIKVDGTNLFAERDYRYFSDVIPYKKFKNSTPTGFYSYTFSLYPLEDQNSGHLNFSHFFNIELTVKSNQEAFSKYGSYNLNTCIKEYNILRIMSGLASTAWID